jgi:hypothetical protein
MSRKFWRLARFDSKFSDDMFTPPQSVKKKKTRLEVASDIPTGGSVRPILRGFSTILEKQQKFSN